MITYISITNIIVRPIDIFHPKAKINCTAALY